MSERKLTVAVRHIIGLWRMMTTAVRRVKRVRSATKDPLLLNLTELKSAVAAAASSAYRAEIQRQIRARCPEFGVVTVCDAPITVKFDAIGGLWVNDHLATWTEFDGGLHR